MIHIFMKFFVIAVIISYLRNLWISYQMIEDRENTKMELFYAEVIFVATGLVIAIALP